MRVRRRLLSVLVLPFLVACSARDDSSSTEDPTSGDAANDAAASDEFAQVELTDALMEQYVALLKDARDSKGGFTFLARYGWSMEKWLTVQGKVTQGIMSASRAEYGAAATPVLAEYAKQIAEIEAKLPAASGDERTLLEEQLGAMREARDAMTSATEGVTDLDRRNMEVLRRWIPKIEALDSGK